MFTECQVEANGFRIRCIEAGRGPPLVHLPGAGGLQLNRAHELLSRQFRVVALEMPGFGQSPANTRTRDMAELASTMAEAIEKLGIESFNLWGTFLGGTTALWLAFQHPGRVLVLVLEAPAAIRPEGWKPPSGSPEAIDPALQAKTRPLLMQLRRPDRDADLERVLLDLKAPTLVLFGTLDGMIPPEMGHLYKELIPNCNLVFVYDAGHAIGTERPEAFTEVVADFLERHEAFIISRTETVIHP